jgi:hypothetical protein
MNTQEFPKVTGQVSFVLRGPDGKIKDEKTIKNLVVNTGLGYIVSRMTGVAQNVMSHMALGTSDTAAAAANVALGTEVSPRNTIDSAVISGSNNEIVTYTASFAVGEATGAITEAGLFNAASDGTMLCRTTFPVVNKQAGDSLSVSWAITLSAA